MQTVPVKLVKHGRIAMNIVALAFAVVLAQGEGSAREDLLPISAANGVFLKMNSENAEALKSAAAAILKPGGKVDSLFSTKLAISMVHLRTKDGSLRPVPLGVLASMRRRNPHLPAGRLVQAVLSEITVEELPQGQEAQPNQALEKE